MVTQTSSYRCSVCGILGHNKRTCSKRQKKQRKCRLCGQVGHYANNPRIHPEFNDFKTWQERNRQQQQPHEEDVVDEEEIYEDIFETYTSHEVPRELWWAMDALGLPKNIRPTEDSLKAAFRKMIFNVHPDRGGSTITTQRVNQARAEIQQWIGV